MVFSMNFRRKSTLLSRYLGFYFDKPWDEFAPGSWSRLEPGGSTLSRCLLERPTLHQENATHDETQDHNGGGQNLSRAPVFPACQGFLRDPFCDSIYGRFSWLEVKKHDTKNSQNILTYIWDGWSLDLDTLW